MTRTAGMSIDAFPDEPREPRPAPSRRLPSLRVAVLSDATPGRNGVGTYYDDLVQHLDGRIGDVRLLCPPRDHEPAEGGWRFRMPGDPTQTMFIPRVGRLWKEIRAMAPDLVIAPTPWLYGILGMLAARRAGAAFSVAYHTEFPMLAELYWGRRKLLTAGSRWLARGVDDVMFRSASAVLVHNHRLRESVRSRGVREAHLMGTPAPPAFLSRPLAPLADRVGTLVYVGRLAPEKNIDQILETARRFPDLNVTLVGDGPLRVEVEAARRERPNLHLTGWVDRDRVLDLLDTSDVLVLPSSHETFGTAAFEGMIRRRLVLVSPECGIAEWPDLSGGLCRMTTGERLAEAVARVAAMNGFARRHIAERGRAAAVALHERTVDHWVSVLDALATATPRS